MSSARHRGYSGSSCYEEHQQEYEKYVKLMWKEPVLSKKRREYEKKANEIKEQQKLCGEGGTSIFDAGEPPQKLWTMAYNKRKIDLSGLLGPEETIVAVAKGMRPGPAAIALEDRAVIKGGLMVLFAAGLSTYDPTLLKVTTANLAKDDKKLIEAAGVTPGKNIGKSLSEAADKVRKKVSKYGDSLKKAAWGLRGLYILGTLVGFQMVTAAAALGVNFIPGAGQIISATLAAKSGVTSAVANNVKNQLNGFVEAGLTEFGLQNQKAQEEQQIAQLEREERRIVSGTPQQGGAASVLASVPTWGWAAGAAAVVGIVYVSLRRR